MDGCSVRALHKSTISKGSLFTLQIYIRSLRTGREGRDFQSSDRVLEHQKRAPSIETHTIAQKPTSVCMHSTEWNCEPSWHTHRLQVTPWPPNLTCPGLLAVTFSTTQHIANLTCLIRGMMGKGRLYTLLATWALGKGVVSAPWGFGKQPWASRIKGARGVSQSSIFLFLMWHVIHGTIIELNLNWMLLIEPWSQSSPTITCSLIYFPFFRCGPLTKLEGQHPAFPLFLAG